MSRRRCNSRSRIEENAAIEPISVHSSRVSAIKTWLSKNCDWRRYVPGRVLNASRPPRKGECVYQLGFNPQHTCAAVLLALAKHPNIAVKASAVTDYSSEAYPFPILHSYLRQVFDAFGPK
jgi:hypothetical protein